MGKACLFSSDLPQHPGLHSARLFSLPLHALPFWHVPHQPISAQLLVGVVAADLLTSCAMLQYMTYHGVECEILPLPTCEPNKSFNLIFQVAERLEAFKLNRSDQVTLLMLPHCDLMSVSNVHYTLWYT